MKKLGFYFGVAGITGAVIFGILIFFRKADAAGQKGNVIECAESSDRYLLSSEEDFVSQEYRENQEKTGMAYTNLVRYWLARQQEAGVTPTPDAYGCMHTHDGVLKEFFPEWYGGCYVNKYGEMVLEIVENYATKELAGSEAGKEILAATGLSPEAFVIRYVPYSYRELMQGTEGLFALLVADEPFVAGYGIDEYDNRIGIDVIPEKLSEAQEAMIKEALRGIPYTIHYGIHYGEEGYGIIDEAPEPRDTIQDAVEPKVRK